MSTTDPQICIVFGLCGAGKTYIARLLQQHWGFYHLEGDDLLPQEIREKVAQRMPISESSLCDYADLLIAAVQRLSMEHPKVVLSQALYLQSTREYIAARLGSVVQFLEISTDPSLLKERIVARFDAGESFVDLASAEVQAPWFESMPTAYPIYNNTAGPYAVLPQVTAALHAHACGH